MQKRISIGLIALVLVLLGGAWLLRPARSESMGASLNVSEALAENTEGFARATEPRPFSFPADHGPHNEYKTEWWYYTGNLDTADGRHFGYQLTFFRSGATPDPADRDSQWATQNIYMAHFALTDADGPQFYAFDRFSRDGAGLAGAQAEPFRVWTESWQASGDPQSGTRLTAAQGTVAIDLVARSIKPPVLQGDHGYSRKSDAPGAASYYYSLTRMASEGTITIDGEAFDVTGFSWLDREWSTSILAPNQTGWDWFALQFDDDHEMMYFQIRLADGGVEPLSHGSLVAADGSKTELALDRVQLDVLDSWTSPHTGAAYPSRWRLQVPNQQLDLTIEPFINDQELRISFVYWEGAVRFTGTRAGQPVSGVGYVEMTGYGEQDARGMSRTR